MIVNLKNELNEHTIALLLYLSGMAIIRIHAFGKIVYFLLF